MNFVEKAVKNNSKVHLFQGSGKCGFTKFAIPRQVNVLKKRKNNKNVDQNIMYGFIDCLQEKQVCGQAKSGYYPTMSIWVNGKKTDQFESGRGVYMYRSGYGPNGPDVNLDKQDQGTVLEIDGAKCIKS